MITSEAEKMNLTDQVKEKLDKQPGVSLLCDIRIKG